MAGSLAFVSASGESEERSTTASEDRTKSTSLSGDRSGHLDESDNSRQRAAQQRQAEDDGGSQHSNSTPLSELAAQALRDEDVRS